MSAVKQKIDAVRKVSAPIPRATELLSMLTRHIEQEARAYLGTVVEAMILEVETKVFSDILDAISMPAMIAMVEIDGVERAALVDMDLDLVYHVVDLRMGGMPSELPEFGARRPTSLDNEICAALIDIVVGGLSNGMSHVFGADDVIDMHCTGFEHLPMLANITGEKSDVLSIQVSLDIGEAARSGNFNLVLPFSSLDIVKAQLQRSGSKSSAASNDAWAQHMIDVALDTEIELTPVLYSSEFTVGQLARLEIGQVIRLEPGAHREIALQQSDGGEPVQIATARLGTLKENKALKLTSSLNQTFLEPMRTVLDQQLIEEGGLE